MMRLLLIAVLLLGSVTPATAIVMADYEFASETQRERFRELLSELRCLVCQNESLSASQADLAKDLRDQVYEQLRKGKSNEEIIEYLVTRYGDYVRYRPPITPGTYLLWFGPAAVFFIGLAFAIRLIYRRRQNESHLSDADRRRAAELLDDNGGRG